MRLRYLSLRDINGLMSFFPDLYESNFPDFKVHPAFLRQKAAELRRAFRDPGQLVLVADDGAGLGGFIWLSIEVFMDGRRTGEVAAIYVAPYLRGQGLGRRLMAEAEAYFAGQGVERIYLMVTAANETAVSLYRHLGYGVTRLQMEKEL